MNDALIKQWRELAAAARQWHSPQGQGEPGRDPAPVLEALALSVALELTGDLPQVPPGERDGLRKAGQRALLVVGGPVLSDPALDEDDVEALRLSAAIARDGLRALSSRSLPDEPRAPIDARRTITSAELVLLLGGRLDGLAAGSLAMRIRRSDEALGELRALTRLSLPEERSIALAAADPGAVLDPATGRAVGALPSLGAEAVLFEGTPRRLAVYAEDPYPLRLVAPELTTEDVREGYWIGRVSDGAACIEATLHVLQADGGDRVERWVLDLS